MLLGRPELDARTAAPPSSRCLNVPRSVCPPLAARAVAGRAASAAPAAGVFGRGTRALTGLRAAVVRPVPTPIEDCGCADGRSVKAPVRSAPQADAGRASATGATALGVCGLWPKRALTLESACRSAAAPPLLAAGPGRRHMPDCVSPRALFASSLRSACLFPYSIAACSAVHHARFGAARPVRPAAPPSVRRTTDQNKARFGAAALAARRRTDANDDMVYYAMRQSAHGVTQSSTLRGLT